MLSVLIPTYNYDVGKLVRKVHMQLNASKIMFEIIILEDGSSQDINTKIHLSHTKILVHKHNLGRVKARQFLAKSSKYDWLLFLDADVLPKMIVSFLITSINQTLVMRLFLEVSPIMMKDRKKIMSCVGNTV